MHSARPSTVPLLLGVCLLLGLSSRSAATLRPQAGHGDRVQEKIAFQSRRSGTSQIWIMNADGTEQIRLTHNSADELMPAISPDRRQIAFVSDRDGSSKVYLMDLDGSNQRPLTKQIDIEEEPVWAPDGTQVLYRKTLPGGGVGIFAANVAAGEPRLVMGGELRPKEPDLSPDGSMLLFNAMNRGSAEIWIVSAESDEPHRLPDTPDWGMAPVWSPDGQRIAFGLLDPSSFSARVHVMSADGSRATTLTAAGETSEYPCWSPDGERIAFQTYRDGNFEIYVMKSDGTGLRRLTNDPAFDGRPSWR